MNKYLSSLIIVLTLGFVTTGIITSCRSQGPVEPGEALVITEDSNVLPEKLGTAEVVYVPIEKLGMGGEVGQNIKDHFAKKGTKPVMTREKNMLPDPKPNTMIIHLDQNAAEDLFSSDFFGSLTQLASTINPWIGAGIGAIGLLFKRPRKNLANAGLRILPGVQGPDPSDPGRIPGHVDFREALVDVARAVTFLPPQEYEEVKSDPKQVNG